MKKKVNPTLLTITGPSCSGKTTMQNLLMEKGFNAMVSFTTRPQRTGEIEGKDYYFFKNDMVDALEQNDGIAESVIFSGYKYGLTGIELGAKLTKGHCVAVVEPNGAIQLSDYCKRNSIRHKSIFIANPDSILVPRFLLRFREDNKGNIIDYSRRLIHMMKEEQNWIHAMKYDFIVGRYESTCTESAIQDVIRVVYND